jgi:hypothetical protein
MEAIEVDLIFPDSVYVKTNNGANYLSWRYRMTSVYDPDPLVGSSTVPGYGVWASFHKNYRVLAIDYSIDIGNVENTRVDVIDVPSTEDLGANYLRTPYLVGNPLCSQAFLGGGNAMNRTRLKGHIDLGSYWGNHTQ